MNHDTLLDAARRAPRLAGRGLIKAYRLTLSPLVGFLLAVPALAFAIALRRGGPPPDRETAAAAAEPVIGAELA